MVSPPRRHGAPKYLAAAVVLMIGAGSRLDAEAGRFWRSLLLPGWGQHIAGRPQSAVGFAATEAVLWLGYAGSREVSHIRRRTYRTYAAVHAGARPEGKTRAYFDDLGFYASRLQHNRFAVVDDGPEADLYPHTPEFAWGWDDDASRRRYRQLRNAAESMERHALFVTGLVFVNHLVAAVHAARLEPPATGPDPPEDRAGLTWQVRPEGLGLSLTRRFR